MARIRNARSPEVGAEAPEFNLPSAQGGNLKLSVRTPRGPVIVAFFRDVSNEDDVAFFRALAAKEDEINAAIGSVVGVCVSEPEAAREFQRAVGLKSYVLYDYTKTAAPAWGVLSEDGTASLPATFVVDRENKISAAWTDERPTPEELLAAITAITGLPKEPEEPEKTDGAGEGEARPESSEKPARRRGRKPEPGEGD